VKLGRGDSEEQTRALKSWMVCVLQVVLSSFFSSGPVIGSVGRFRLRCHDGQAD
jgi:hypothetical protein